MSSAHSRSPEDITNNDVGVVQANNSVVSTEVSSSLAMSVFLAPVYYDVTVFVKDPSNFSGVRSDTVQANVDRIIQIQPWYWKPEDFAVLKKHVKSSDVLQAMFDDANQAKEVAKQAFFTAIEKSTSNAVTKAVESAVATASVPVPAPVPAPAPASAPAAPLTAVVQGKSNVGKEKPGRKATKVVLVPRSIKGSSKVGSSQFPALDVTVAAKDTARSDDVSPAPDAAGKSSLPLTTTPDPTRRDLYDALDLDDWEDDDSIQSFGDEGDDYLRGHGPHNLRNSGRKVVQVLSDLQSPAKVERIVRAAQAQAAVLPSLSPSAFLSLMVVGSGVVMMGVSGGVHVIKARIDNKKRLTFLVTSLRGPRGTAATGPAVNGEGEGYRFIPFTGHDVDVQFRLDILMAYPGPISDADAARTLRERDHLDRFIQVFRMRATRVMGTSGWSDPWSGHPNRCSLFLWVVIWLIYRQTVSQTMLTSGDPARLLETFEALWRLADQANLLSSDPANITPEEFLAAMKVLGAACEACGTCGYPTVACPTCGSLSSRYEVESQDYYKARGAWVAKDKPREKLAPDEKNRLFKDSAEYKAYLAQPAVATSATAGKGVTAAACVAYAKNHQNKIARPLEPPSISYR